MQQRKWYVINSESKGNYAHNDPIKFLTKSIESSLCDQSDAYILVTGNIAAKMRTDAAADDMAIDAATQIAFKIVHHLKIVEQKLMIHLLIMHILLILQCQCTI